MYGDRTNAKCVMMTTMTRNVTLIMLIMFFTVMHEDCTYTHCTEILTSEHYKIVRVVAHAGGLSRGLFINRVSIFEKTVSG